MSTASPRIGTVERASDWLNPILVKETRQALKSRQFVATFQLMLVASWLISVFGVVFAGAAAEYQELGKEFFRWYYGVLAVAVFLVVPFGAFRSLLMERDLHAWEVLSITTLKPRQIVWGKLLSSLVQIFIYYSAITPFMAFAELLKGIDVLTIAFVLAASLGWAVALSLYGLAISTFGSQRYWQVFLTLAMLIMLLVALYMAIALVNIGMEGMFTFDLPEFWWFVAVIASFVAAYCVLMLQVAIGQLTFDADNRATGVRLAACGVFALALGWMYLGIDWHGSGGIPSLVGAGTLVDDLMITFSILAAMHWIVVGLFSVTQADALSKRVRRSLVRFWPARVLLAPLFPGGARGMIYLLMNLLVLWGFVLLVLNGHGGYKSSTICFVSALCCYVVFYLGLGSALGRSARAFSAEFHPAHARVLTVLIFALAAILPQTLYLFDEFRSNPRPQFWITDPFSTLNRLASNDPDSVSLMTLLGLGTFIVLLLNLRAMLRGVVEVAQGHSEGAT